MAQLFAPECLPAAVRTVILCPDGNPSAAAARLARDGRQVKIAAVQEGVYLNDLLME